jgi:SprB repeat
MKRNLLPHLAILIASCYATCCTYNEVNVKFNCNTSTLTISLVSKKDATSCKSIDGQIVVSSTGGIGGYDFSLGDGVYQTNPVFDRLAPGSYLVTVKDLKSCKRSVQIEIGADGSTLAASATASADTQCFSDNGTISITASGGSPPYVLKIDDGTFGTATSFSNLGNANHKVIIKDNADCERVLIVNVPRGDTGTSFSVDIQPIFVANCDFSQCHGAGTTGRDWTKLSDVQAKAIDIKNRTSNRSMPIGNLTLTTQEIQKIACWVDDGAKNN